MKGTFGGARRGAYRLITGMFQIDRLSDPLVTEASIRSTAANPGQEVTYTCVPPGAGQRIGVDRDGEGFFDQDELDAGSDPADPTSIPPGATTTTTTSSTVPTTSTTTIPGSQPIKGSSFILRDPVPGNYPPGASR